MDNGSETGSKISNKTYSSDLGSKTEIVDGIEIKSERSTGKAIYSGAASLGRFLTMVFLFVAIFAGIIMVIYGIIVIRRRHNHSEKTQGTVVSASCTHHRCYNVKVTYTPGTGAKQAHTFGGIETHIQYNAGDPITLYYGKNDVTKVDTWDSSTLLGQGIAFIVGGVVIVALMLFLNYLVRRFKVAAAIAGPVELLGILV